MKSFLSLKVFLSGLKKILEITYSALKSCVFAYTLKTAFCLLILVIFVKGSFRTLPVSCFNKKIFFLSMTKAGVITWKRVCVREREGERRSQRERKRERDSEGGRILFYILRYFSFEIRDIRVIIRWKIILSCHSNFKWMKIPKTSNKSWFDIYLIPFSSHSELDLKYLRLICLISQKNSSYLINRILG